MPERASEIFVRLDSHCESPRQYHLCRIRLSRQQPPQSLESLRRLIEILRLVEVLRQSHWIADSRIIFRDSLSSDPAEIIRQSPLLSWTCFLILWSVKRVALVYGAPAGVGGLGVQVANAIQALAIEGVELHAFGPGRAKLWPLHGACPRVLW